MYIMSLRAKAAGAQQVDDLDEAGLVGADEAVAHGEVDDDERRVGLPQRELVADTLQYLARVGVRVRARVGVGVTVRVRVRMLCRTSAVGVAARTPPPKPKP